MERKPRQLPQYTNLVLTFDAATWAMALLALLAVPLALVALGKVGGVDTKLGVCCSFFTSFGPFHKLTVIYFPSETIIGPDLYDLWHCVPRVQMENPLLKVRQDIQRLPAPAVDPDFLDSLHFLLQQPEG